MRSKKWYTSKTFWVNLLAIIAIVAQNYTDTEIVVTELQTPILVLINLILRTITNEKIEW